MRSIEKRTAYIVILADLGLSVVGLMLLYFGAPIGQPANDLGVLGIAFVFMAVVLPIFLVAYVNPPNPLSRGRRPPFSYYARNLSPVNGSIITVKYKSRCIRCNRLIRPGERAFWKKGLGIWHDSCG
jgi:hypothetical protein